MAGRARVAIGMIAHETNVFSPVPTPLRAFEEGRGYGVLRGRRLLEAYRGTRSSLGGFIEAADREGWEVVPTIAASATPSGVVSADAYRTLKGWLLEDLRRAQADGGIDAVLLMLHGAMVAEGAPDAEGDICLSVRELIGDRPLLLQMDLHGNISAEMCGAVNGVFAYDTNPHVDGYERALEAAEALARIFAGGPPPRVYLAKPGMMPPTINMRTAEGPMAELLALGREWEARPGVLNVSVFGGFPYSDVPVCGLAAVVTATDPGAGQAAADAVARRAWEIRERFLKPLVPIAAAVDRVRESMRAHPRPFGAGATPSQGPKPLALADVADNPGGGGSGDTTELLRALVAAECRGVAVAALWDPATVARAFDVGVGNEAEFRIGGRAEPRYGVPAAVRARVRALTDGRFIARGPMGRGMVWHMGPTAVLEIGGPDGIAVVCTGMRLACNDLGVFRSAGVEPLEQRALVIKSRGHFRAAFEPVVSEVLEVDAPGAAHPDLSRFPFRNVPRPVWPLDPL